MRRTLPAGAIELRAVSNGSVVASTIVPPADAPRQLIVQFAAPPAAEARRKNLDLEVTRLPYRRFLTDLAGIEAAARAESGGRTATMRVRRRFEVSFNGMALTASQAFADRVRALPYVSAVYADDSVHVVLDQSLVQIKADALRSAYGLSGSGVVVSIIDTGLDYGHPALGGCLAPGCRVIGGYDFVNDDADPMDDHGHGTHVAGIVGGSGAGLTGVAPATRFLAYKALAASGSGTLSDVIAGIERSLDPDGDPLTDDAADVINLSIGGPGDADGPLAQAIDQAVAAGVVCVVAAGNSGDYFAIESAGSARRAITVGAATAQDGIASFSSRGPSTLDQSIKPDVVAPGVSIVSTWLGGGALALSGTSMATPHVAGVAALLLELHPDWTPAVVKSALMNSAVDVGQNPFQQGAGRIDALAAGQADVTIEPASLSFGLSPMSETVWSAAQTLTVHNESATVRLVTFSTISDLPPGSSLEVWPPSLSLGAGETRSVEATLTLDHAPRVASAPYAYDGALQASIDERILRVPFAVLRTPHVQIRVDAAGLVIVHDRSGFNHPFVASGPGSTRLFLPAGTYDAMAFLGFDRRVVREDIVVADGETVDLFQADAIHTVQRVCIDELGLPVSMPVGIESLTHHEAGIGIVSFGGIGATTRFTPISPAYDLEWHRLTYGQEPKTYDFQGFQRGVSASTVEQNAPGDLRHLTLAYHPSPEVQQLVPVRWVSDGPRGIPFGNGFAVSTITNTALLPPLEAPFVQDAYFMSTPDPDIHYKSRVYDAYPYVAGAHPSGTPELETPYLIADPQQPVHGYLYGNDTQPIVTFAEDRLEIGLGPPTWFGSFRNSADVMRLSTQIGNGGWLFLTQQGSWRDHSQLPFELAREAIVVETGTLTAGLTRTLVPGTHTLTLINDRYWIAGERGRATVVATFQSLAADPDPPFLNDVSVLVNGVPSDVAEAGAPSVVQFTVEDAIALGSVTLASRFSEVAAWSPMLVSRTGNRFEAALPSERGGSLSLRIDATDAAGNRLTYSIEPAIALRGTTTDLPPQVTLLSPVGGESWASGSHHDITWSATDDFGVTSITLQVSADGGAHYVAIASGLPNAGTYDWTVPLTAGDRMRVKVIAFDSGGNTGEDTSAADFAITDPTPPPASPNLVGNGGFESNLDGWTRYGSATLSQANEGHSGTRSLQMRGSSRSSFGCDDSPNWVTAVAAKDAVYRISAWVKTPTGGRGTVRIRVYEYLGSSQQGSTTYSNQVVLSEAWTRLTLDYTVRTAGSTLSMRVADAPAASGETFLVDDVSIELLGAEVPDEPPPPPGSTLTFERRVVSGNDDAEESSSGGMSLSSSDLELTEDGSPQTVGVRFRDVQVPPGAAIINAFVQFQADESHSGSTNLTIRGELDPNPSSYSSSNKVTSRAPTSAAVAWNNVPAWGTGEQGPAQRTPDLAAIIREIVGLGDWQSGNALAIIISGAGKRVAESFEGQQNAAAQLVIEYSTGDSPPIDPPPIDPPPTNRPPVVDAGPGQTVTGPPASALLAGTATDDGLPLPANLVATWTGTGPGSVTFDDVHTVDTHAAFSAAGVYVLRLEANDGAATVSDTMTVHVVAPGTAAALDRRVAYGEDDAEENSSGRIDLSSSDLELTEDRNAQVIGMRFRNITIPRGALITSADLQFQADERHSGSTTLAIAGHAVDDAPPFTSAARGISNRARTEMVPWPNVPAWNTVGEQGAPQKSPDIRAVIQAIVSRSGWQSGNSIALIIIGSGKRVAESYNGETGGAPLLHIEYTPPAAAARAIEPFAIERFAPVTGPTRAVVAPNPMRGTSSLHLTLAKAGAVHIRVFDVQGREVQPVVAGEFGVGEHRIRLDRSSGLGTGLYFYRIVAPDAVLKGRFLVVE